MAVREVFGADVAWHAEIDSDASAVLAARLLGVINHGDLTRSWACWEPVDIVCGGWPCQTSSTAGKRKGREDERWIWPEIAAGIGALATRPRWVVLENVPGVLSVDRGAAFADVIGDLAHLGYVGSWRVVTAASVGAPHRRARVFIVARHADGPRPASDADGVSTRRDRRADALAQGGDGRRAEGDRDGPADGPRAAAVADRDGRSFEAAALRTAVAEHDLDGCDASTRWGQYGPAIARWEAIVGRAAPWPPLIGRQVNARLPEWMMGLPDGWVTDLLPNRRALKVIGNGVCPQQASSAIRSLVEGMM